MVRLTGRLVRPMPHFDRHRERAELSIIPTPVDQRQYHWRIAATPGNVENEGFVVLRYRCDFRSAWSA
jgi:hypothetical protein